MMRYFNASILLYVGFFLSFSYSYFAYAQGADVFADDSENNVSIEQAIAQVEDGAVSDVTDRANVTLREPYPFAVEDMPSLFFNFWQHRSIQEAKNSRGTARAPTLEEIDSYKEPEESLKPKPEEREIRLAGIVYGGKSDWTIWLNGERVTPSAIPEQVMDLRVYKDYIEVKWYDRYTNQIFPLRLRAHQRFNMDMRIFLSGD